MWIKNTMGRRDAMLTMSILTFFVVTFKILLAGVEVGEVKFGTIDGGLVAAFLAPTLGAYVARRHSDNSTKKE